ncbi:MAG: sigma 54-interacting transcriptional regulator [Desulfitobacteriaceae bacterium]|nr:sigma 54-interacting transcriptional regulator [Desulfitobacteriaceae bacterium]MDI6914476.1 sigma 54-interacting transcriptional regulator [Desulfitobacteriaceae bacterium]
MSKPLLHSYEDFIGHVKQVFGSQLFEESGDTVLLVIDQDSTIVHTNSAYADILGIQRELVLGRKLSDIEPRSGGVQVLKSGHPWMGKSLLESVHRLAVVGTAVPIRNGNSLQGAVSIFSSSSDINGAKRGMYKMVGSSSAFNRVLDIVLKVSRTNCSILITGESGVGKELVADAIHYASPRRTGSFVSLNCAAIPEHLLESELFGYEPGAFTGATKNGKPGKILLANHGTLFLDEVGEMSPSMQAKLLRAIQQKEIEPVGGSKPIPVDFRIIAATNKDLVKLVQDGKFREDLYYRLNVIPIEVPPLRERKEDIPDLCNHFLGSYAMGSFKVISDAAYNYLLNYDWPGNIRQLKNAIEYASIMAGNIIEPNDFPNLPNSPTLKNQKHTLTVAPGKTLHELIGTLEKNAIMVTLEATNFNKTEASKMLGISRQALYLKAQEYGIELQMPQPFNLKQ